MPVTLLREISLKELLAMLSPQTRPVVRERAARLKASHVVLFENLDMSSSHLGARTALIIGPDCTYKSLDDIREAHLGQVPSVFQYPTCYAKVS